MTHVFKPGDKAYWVKNGWIDLIENPERDSSLYPLRDKESRGTFTVEGQRHARGGDIVLLPINPTIPRTLSILRSSGASGHSSSGEEGLRSEWRFLSKPNPALSRQEL